MLKILSELLNIAQIETGKMQLNIMRVPPQVIVENAIASVRSAATEKTS